MNNKLSMLEINLLKACKSYNDWTAIREEIVRCRGNNYPPDWQKNIIDSGLMDQTFACFWSGVNTEIHGTSGETERTPEKETE